MEIKHTFEILAKDIQDIEKLVRNIQNSPKPSSIDLDLALARIRNVYEVLLMVREDNLSGDNTAIQQQEKKVNMPVEGQPEIMDEPREVDHHAIHLAEEETMDISGQIIIEKIREHEPGSGTVDAGPDIIKGTGEGEKIKEATPGNDEPARTKTEKPKKEAEILAEKFNKESSINENLGLKRSGDMTSRLASQPIDSISRNIGINDRFYIIKELFKGDSDGYNSVIRNLDQSNNFNEAFHILENRFPDTLDHDGVQILVNLVRRRFISSGNV